MIQHRHILATSWLTLCVAGAGCEEVDMKRQPSYRPLEPSAVFANGISARPLVEGTVAREQSGSTVEIIADGEFISRVPMPVTYEMLSRGRERFDIYCAPCHGLDGSGFGIIVQRGYTQPPSFHTERSRLRADGFIFSIISIGYGWMPPYAQQVRVEDRWAIVAYLRALQLSQYAKADVYDSASGVPEGRPDGQ